MIKISREAIDSTLEETLKLHSKGKLVEFQLSIERRIGQEKPFLGDYINSGIEDLKIIEGEDGELIRGGYLSGAHLTFRMIETQLKMDKQQSPDINELDIQATSKDRDSFIEMEVSDIIMAKIAQIKRVNLEFGEYVKTYVLHQVPNKMIARGFAMGVVTTYSAYEQALRNRE
ncbi:hypothetical protein HYV50_05610 [Candidatus Pacearchaeota archaeon]|nr:hypothetical protein [Candidatus Pacearchaeota archaeon]